MIKEFEMLLEKFTPEQIAAEEPEIAARMIRVFSEQLKSKHSPREDALEQQHAEDMLKYEQLAEDYCIVSQQYWDAIKAKCTFEDFEQRSTAKGMLELLSNHEERIQILTRENERKEILINRLQARLDSIVCEEDIF